MHPRAAAGPYVQPPQQVARRHQKICGRTRYVGPTELNKVEVSYLGGATRAFSLAANDVLKDLDFLNITFVLLVIYLCCAFTFRSPIAGALFIVSCIMANFGAFVYMNARNIGLTIDTIPVISLGIGLGVDYGIYTVARIRDEVSRGSSDRRRGHDDSHNHWRCGFQHIRGDGRRYLAVGFLAAAVSQ